MASDLEYQKRQTFSVFEDLRSRQNLPEMAIVDFQFIAVSSIASSSGFINEVNAIGYKSHCYEDGSTVEISTRPILLNAERIWFHEELFALIGQKYGFAPDGWGFFGVESGDTYSS